MNKKNDKVVLCLRDGNQRIVVLCVGYSDAEINNILKEHPNYHRSYTLEAL